MSISVEHQYKIDAPIKLNLNLHIIGQNTQNYHLLQGVSIFAEMGDQLDIYTSTKSQAADRIQLTGAYADFLRQERDQDNLVMKAIHFLRQNWDFPTIEITIEKNIPLQAGYGGGSSDAAATLIGINQLFNLNIPLTRLYDIGKKIGADVPMCLYGCLYKTPCFIDHVGDHITALKPLNHRYACILLKPKIMLSTPYIFKMLKKKQHPPMQEKQNLINEALSSKGRNDLWETVCKIAPEISTYLEVLQTTNPLKANMSGSGSGLFALYEDNKNIENIYQTLKARFPNDFLCRTYVNL